MFSFGRIFFLHIIAYFYTKHFIHLILLTKLLTILNFLLKITESIFKRNLNRTYIYNESIFAVTLHQMYIFAANLIKIPLVFIQKYPIIIHSCLLLQHLMCSHYLINTLLFCNLFFLLFNSCLVGILLRNSNHFLSFDASVSLNFFYKYVFL